MTLALGVVNPGLSQDTQPVITPNAMIILDSSFSMNFKIDGSTAGASWVKVDADGNKQGSTDYQPPGIDYPFEGGGDHPDSKLYLAKLALKKVTKNLENINLGFSTYGQFKTENRRGKYVRDRQDWNPGTADTPATKNTCTWKKLYWRWNTQQHCYNSTSYLPFGSFKDVWGNDQTGMDMGSKLYEKNHTLTKKVVPPHPPDTYKDDLEYSIWKIDFNAELNYTTYYYCSTWHDIYEFTDKTKVEETWDPDCNSIAFDCDSKFPLNWGDGYTTYLSTDTKYPDNSPIVPANKWKCKGPFWAKGSDFKAGKLGWFGSVWQENAWLTYGGFTDCPDTWGADVNWDAVNKKAISDGSTGYTKWSAVNKSSNCYDVSDYKYPADGTGTKPHTWSYIKVDKSGNWPPAPNPSYPSRDDKNNINNNPGQFDNHYFFINFPPVDDSTNNYAVKKSILDLLDLTPVQNPETTRYHTKLPVKSRRFLDPPTNSKPDNSITSNTVGVPVSQTPIYDSLTGARQYFYDYINTYNGGDAASKANCRGNFIILLTDGLESCRYIDVYHPNFQLAVDAAKDLYKNLGVSTFVIGFGKDAGASVAVLNAIANAGSDGKYAAFFAVDLDTLILQINTIFKMIFDSVSRGNPAVSTDRVSKDKNRFYRGFFKPGWEGHLVSYKLDADGNIGAEVWDAGTVMAIKKDRGYLYTWVEEKLFPERVDFRTREKDLYDLVNPLGEDIDGDSKVHKDDSKTVINFTINPGYDSKKYKGFRSGDWFLGDLYHSTPLPLGPPAFKFPDDKFPKKYSTFKESWKDRETLLYVGANDGMIHAFDKDGIEKFAVLPRNTLGNLKELRNKDHQFFVDSSPRMSDAYAQGKWRTVILTGERGGGNSYFCLDVTDPGDPVIMWEKSDSGMGNTWSRPEIGWVKIGGKEKFVAFVGGGYSVAEDVGNTFYVLDMEDGTILRKFAVGDKKNKVAAGATAFDSDLDGRVDGVYFGDTSGVLWKIKIDLEEDISKWALIKLFDPGTKYPIFYPPVVTKNNQKKILVYFGQGDEMNIYDDTIANSFFEIWDKGDTGELSWERKLEKGEKVLASPAFANNIIYFTTFKYTGVVDNCGAGIGRIYGLTGTRDGITGNKAALYLNPLTGEALKDPKEYITITDYFPKLKGIPSAPVIVMGQKYIYFYFSTSGSSSGGVGRNLPAGQARLKYWREKSESN
jgi:hypothetical protein